MTLQNDILEVVSALVYSGIPFQIRVARSYAVIDTDAKRLFFSRKGWLSKSGVFNAPVDGRSTRHKRSVA